MKSFYQEVQMLCRMLSFAVLSLVVVLSPQLRAADAADDQAFFDKQMSKFIKLEPKRLPDDLVGKVFNATFYSVALVTNDGGSTNNVVARTGDDITLITIPSSTADMPEFVKLLKPDFAIKSDADAKAFQDALDVLYPIDARFNKDDLNAKAIRHAGNNWTFIRGKFFDHFRGFIITTDTTGKVTAVKWTLDDIK